MYIVTGGLGFIGSYITMGLLSQGRKVLVVDRITEEKMRKFDRFASASYMDRDEFFSDPAEVVLDPKVEGVFHQGACSSTTHPDSKYVMENNYTKSIALIDACMKYDVPLVYASSAAVYGQGLVHYHFREDPSCETPLNVYGYSKLLVDRYVRQIMNDSRYDVPLVGLRYFNVYGPGEEEKGKMASIAYQMHRKHVNGEGPVLYGEYGGYPAGEHRRDFVYVGDVYDVNMHFMFGEKARAGIFNVGTGQSRTFNELAKIVTDECPTYADFPKSLEGKYQCFTEADLRNLRDHGGYHGEFTSLENGLWTSKKLWRV